MITIYKITSPSNRIYIGQTKNVTKRKHLYKYSRCKSQRLLFNSIQKYGWESHKFEILEEVPEKLGDIKEIEYIKKYNSFINENSLGMNLTQGGKRPTLSQETRDKISKSITGKHNYRAKTIYQYSIDRKLIKIWDCLKCVERELGYFSSMLSHACKGNNKAYGFIWTYNPL